jgi:hypothetical protein
MLSPSIIILSEAKDLGISLRVNSAKHPRMCEVKQIQRSFVVPTESVGTPQDDKFRGFSTTY